MSINYMKRLNYNRLHDDNKVYDAMFDIEYHKLRYFLLKYIGQEGFLKVERGYPHPLSNPNNVRDYRINKIELKKANIHLYNKLTQKACSLNYTLEDLILFLGFSTNLHNTELKGEFFSYTVDSYLEMFITVEQEDKLLKEDITVYCSSNLLSATFGNDIGRIIEYLSYNDRLISDINERANYYAVDVDKYIEILLFSKGVAYKKFKLRAKPVVKDLMKKICDSKKVVVTPYMLSKDMPVIYTALCELAKEYSMSDFEMLFNLFYKDCYSYLPLYLNNIEDQRTAYKLETFLLNKENITEEIKGIISARCGLHKVNFEMYIKGLSLFFYFNELKTLNISTTNVDVFSYDSIKEDKLRKRLYKIYNNKIIPNLKDLRAQCYDKDPMLYTEITKYAKESYKTVTDLLTYLGFVYLVKYQTKEYVYDNFNRFVVNGKYFCAYANDPFYMMMERMCRPKGSTKSTKESTKGRAELIRYKLHLTRLNANSSKVNSDDLYITPSPKMNTENKINEVFAKACSILERFEYQGIVFLPATHRSKIGEHYTEINKIAFSLGLHLTEFIHKCGYDRRLAGGKIMFRDGSTDRDKSVKHIGKLYLPVGSINEHRTTKEIYDFIMNEVKKSSESTDKGKGNIIKNFQDILVAYADVSTEGHTIYLGEDSELYGIAEEIVGITKVDTIVLILHLGYSVYYVSQEGTVLIKSIQDIFDSLTEHLERSNIYSDRFKNVINASFKIPRRIFDNVRRAYPTKLVQMKNTSIALALYAINIHTNIVELNLATRLAEDLFTRSCNIGLSFELFLSMFSQPIKIEGSLNDFDKFKIVKNKYKLRETYDKGIYITTINCIKYKCLSPKMSEYTKKYKHLYVLHKESLLLSLRDLRRIESEPRKSITVVDKWVRNINMVKPLKEFYDYKCQLCGEENGTSIAIVGEEGKPYVEVHHIRELSATLDETEGTDVEVDTVNNALVVCPQHHKYLHYHKGGLNKLVKREDNVYIENEDGTESIRVITNKHLLMD